MGPPLPPVHLPGELADFIRAASRYASWSFHTWTRLPGGYHVRETPTAGPPGINQNRERIQSPLF